MPVRYRRLLVAVALFCLFFGGGAMSVPAAEEGERSVCPGTWELVYDGGWYVEQEDARLAVRFVTPVSGCTGDELSLDREMSGMPVQVRCRLVETQDGEERRVERLQILCR